LPPVLDDGGIRHLRIILICMCLILFRVGSHWSRQAQADVVAVNWRERAILVGECKWGAEPVERDVVRELVENKSANGRGTYDGLQGNQAGTRDLLCDPRRRGLDDLP